MSLLKTICSKHSIPTYVFTDKEGSSHQLNFKSARCCQFEILHSTHRYPQSNGFIEAIVKIVKQTMSKVEQSGEHPHITVLTYRFTPRSPWKLSPAKAVTQHKFRALLLVKQHLSGQLTTSREIMLHKKKPQQLAEHYICRAHQLQEVQQYQCAINSGQPIWQEATVTGMPTEKTAGAYQVQTNSGAYSYTTISILMTTVTDLCTSDLYRKCCEH